MACIAVFHGSLKVLRLLCEHGAQLSMRSMYNRNAYDLAKDELDAAGNVVVNRSSIRAVIEEFDQHGTKKNSLYGTSSGGGDDNTCGEIVKLDDAVYEGLDKNGSPVVMQLEINKSKQIKAKETSGAAERKGGGGAGKTGAGKKTVKKK